MAAKKPTPDGLLAEAVKMTPGEIVALIAGLIGLRPLVGVKRASQVLGVAAPNFGRHKPKLTEIEVEGSASVYVKSEVEDLADAMRMVREARQ